MKFESTEWSPILGLLAIVILILLGTKEFLDIIREVF